MDLIPEDYKRYLQQLHILQLWAFGMLAFIVVFAAISLSLDYKTGVYQKKIVILEKNKAVTSQQRSLLQNLEKDYKKLTEKHEVLNKLRGGALAEDMFVAIDRALNGNNIWFTTWSFDRAGSKTSEQSKGVNTGYFIVIPENGNNNKLKQAWRIHTHMEVNGGARDHEALSSFVRRLLQQPQIGDIRILNAQQQTYTDKTVVNFRLVITVNSGVANS